jgi:excisionase family DNA binding protein
VQIKDLLAIDIKTDCRIGSNSILRSEPAMVLLNPSETAKELRVHVCTIHRMPAKGSICHHRIGKKIYFTPEDIEQYLKRCAVTAKEGHE